MVKDMCNDINQVEILAIQSRNFLVPVNSLRDRKYVLRKLASMFQFPRTFIQISETKVLAIAKIPIICCEQCFY